VIAVQTKASKPLSAQRQIEEFLVSKKEVVSKQSIASVPAKIREEIDIARSALKRARNAFSELQNDVYSMHSMKIVHSMNVKLALRDCRSALRKIEKTIEAGGDSRLSELTRGKLDEILNKFKRYERGTYRRLRKLAPEVFVSIKNKDENQTNAEVPLVKTNSSTPKERELPPKIIVLEPIKPITEEVALPAVKISNVFNSLKSRITKAVCGITAGVAAFLFGSNQNTNIENKQSGLDTDRVQMIAVNIPEKFIVGKNLTVKHAGADIVPTLNRVDETFTSPRSESVQDQKSTNHVVSISSNSSKSLAYGTKSSDLLPLEPHDTSAQLDSSRSLASSILKVEKKYGPGVVGDSDGLSAIGSILRDQVISANQGQSVFLGATSDGVTFGAYKTEVFNKGLHVAAIRDKDEGMYAFIGLDLYSFGDYSTGSRLNFGLGGGEEYKLQPVVDWRLKYTEDLQFGNLDLEGSFGYYPSYNRKDNKSESKPHFSYDLSYSTYPISMEKEGSFAKATFGLEGSDVIDSETKYHSRYYAELSLNTPIIGKPEKPLDVYVDSSVALEGNSSFHPDEILDPGMRGELSLNGRYKNIYFSLGATAGIYKGGAHNGKGLLRAEYVMPFGNRNKPWRLLGEYQQSLHESGRVGEFSSSNFLPEENGFRFMLSKSF
jgi:hypothetical protein